MSCLAASTASTVNTVNTVCVPTPLIGRRRHPLYLIEMLMSIGYAREEVTLCHVEEEVIVVKEGEAVFNVVGC